MLVSQTADGFRASQYTAIPWWQQGFHTFSLPEDRCVLLLVKNLGKQLPEDVVRQELKTLCISVQGVLQLRVAWCGEPLSYTDRQTSTLTERWPEYPKARKSVSTTCSGYPQGPCPGYLQGGHVDTSNRSQLAIFRLPWLRFSHDFPPPSVVRQMPGYNSQRRGTARTLPK